MILSINHGVYSSKTATTISSVKGRYDRMTQPIRSIGMIDSKKKNAIDDAYAATLSL